ncbi:MAG: hypothetical protein ACREXS_21205 [Gammaproteobacteria bacterium]
MNPQMPRVEGIPEIGGHRVQVSVGDALGSEALYRWLDGNRSVRMLLVTDVNESAVLRRLPRLTHQRGLVDRS